MKGKFRTSSLAGRWNMIRKKLNSTRCLRKEMAQSKAKNQLFIHRLVTRMDFLKTIINSNCPLFMCKAPGSASSLVAWCCRYKEIHVTLRFYFFSWKYRQSFLCHTVMHLEIDHDNNDNYPHNVKISLVYCGHYEEHEFRLTMCG